MNKKQVGSLLIGVGVLLAAVIGVLVYFKLQEAELRAAQVPSRRVVVATRDIPEQGRVELNAVTTASISEEIVPTRPFVRVDDAVGKFARQRIYKGDILSEDRVVSLETIRRDIAQGKPAPAPSLVLDRDQVMMVLPARLTGGFAGQYPNLLTQSDAIRPGDYVDILVTTLEFPEGMTQQQQEEARSSRPAEYLRTRVAFQNLRVFNVGVFPGPEAKEQQAATPPDARYLTFVVDRDTALQLKWLKDAVALGYANIDFVLRSPSNPEELPSQSVALQEMSRRFGLGTRQ